MSAREPDRDGREAGSPAPVRIVLADDHRVVRRGLQMVLDAEPDLVVVAEAGDIESARDRVREHNPDVLVVDLNMPGGSTLTAIPVLRAEAPGTQIVVLTMEQAPAIVREARRLGALGYVLKEAADSELVEAVRRASAGEMFLNRQVASRLFADRSPSDAAD
jgi:two-component system response regulator NreC